MSPLTILKHDSDDVLLCHGEEILTHKKLLCNFIYTKNLYKIYRLLSNLLAMHSTIQN